MSTVNGKSMRPAMPRSLVAAALIAAMSPPSQTAVRSDHPRYTRAEAKKRRRNRMRNKMARISRRINRKRAKS